MCQGSYFSMQPFSPMLCESFPNFLIHLQMFDKYNKLNFQPKSWCPYQLNHFLSVIVHCNTNMIKELLHFDYFFSGTLNPALQDRNGQPKRDITTIIHILNDLLCAQYKNYSATATPTSASSGSQKSKTSSSTTTTSTSGSSATSKSTTDPKQFGNFNLFNTFQLKSFLFHINFIPIVLDNYAFPYPHKLIVCYLTRRFV